MPDLIKLKEHVDKLQKFLEDPQEGNFSWCGCVSECWKNIAEAWSAVSVDKIRIRRAVANYMRSEGCTCCQDVEQHKEDKAVLAKLLDVPTYDDGSGYDFYKFVERV